MGSEGALWVSAGQMLRITTWSSQASSPVCLAGRFRDARGGVVLLHWSHTLTADRAASYSEFPLGEGWLLSLVAHVNGAAVRRGQTFARVELCQGAGAVALPLATLIAHYVSRAESPGWPGDGIESPLAGRGYVRYFIGTDPAGGVEITETVPTGALWRLLSMSAMLVTGPTAGNRRVRVQIWADSTILGSWLYPSDHAASYSARYTWADIGYSQATASGTAVVGWPANCYLCAGWQIVTGTTGLLAEDNWGAPAVVVEEWLAP